MSGIVTISDQRSYIKIKTLPGKNPTEIHCAFSKVCGSSQMNIEQFLVWANRFNGSCVSIE